MVYASKQDGYMKNNDDIPTSVWLPWEPIYRGGQKYTSSYNTIINK